MSDGPNRPTLRRMAARLFPHRAAVAGVAALSALGVAAGLLPPLLARTAMDRVILGTEPGRVRLLALLALGMAAAVVARTALAWLGGLVAARTGARLVADLREALHGTALATAPEAFAKRNPGEFAQRILFDTETVQRFFLDVAPQIPVQTLTALGVACALFALDVRLALVALLPVPALVRLSAGFQRTVRPRFAALAAAIADVDATLSESIATRDTVRSLGAEAWRGAAFRAPTRAVAAERIALARALLRFSGASGVAMALGGVAVWIAAGLETLGGGTVSAGDLTAALAYLAMFYAPVGWFADCFRETVDAVSAAGRVCELLDAPREARGGRPAPARIRKALRFEDVRYAYAPGAGEALSGVSLELRAGETLAVVGPSGAGKSTLAALLCRLRDPTAGAISVDGVPLADIDPAAWRARVAFVPQEPAIFRASAFENIAIARPGATRAEVEAAARAAGAHDFLAARPGGYDAPIAGGGAGLSGGQRQRIALARASLRDPLLLVLDEPTSALDPATEESVVETLDRIRRGRTMLLVTHRPAALRLADRIATLEPGGRLVTGPRS